MQQKNGKLVERSKNTCLDRARLAASPLPVFIVSFANLLLATAFTFTGQTDWYWSCQACRKWHIGIFKSSSISEVDSCRHLSFHHFNWQSEKNLQKVLQYTSTYKGSLLLSFWSSETDRKPDTNVHCLKSLFCLPRHPQIFISLLSQLYWKHTGPWNVCAITPQPTTATNYYFPSKHSSSSFLFLTVTS